MSDKPDIVKKLMEEEQLGKFEGYGTTDTFKVLEDLHEDSFEDVSDKTVGFAETEALVITKNFSDYKVEDETIWESKKLLQNVFDAITDGISILDKELNIVKVNQFMKDFYSDEMPLVGKKCYQIYQQRSSPCPWCPSLSAIETGKTHTETVPFPSKR